MSDLSRHARRISTLETRVRSLARAPQLSNSSVQDGNVNEYDRDGNLASSWGKQWDGSHGAYPVRGPVPPTPSPPIVEGVLGGLRVSWDGLWASPDAVAPMDYARMEVHVSTVEGFDPVLAETLRATIETPRGADVLISMPAGTYWVALVARSLAGKASEGSVQVSATTQSIEDFIGDIGAGTQIYYGPDAPASPAEGELWFAEVAPGQYETRRYVGGAWEPLSSQAATEALAEAISKSEVTSSDTAPADPDTGDLWIDTASENTLKVWTGAAWTPHRFGNGAIEPESLIARDVIATGTISTALLEAEAVTAEKMAVGTITAESGIIADAAIGTAQISELSATKITSGTLDAQVIVSGSISTAATGARVFMDHDGIKAFNNSGLRSITIRPDGAGLVGYMWMPGDVNSIAMTPDAPGLDITGDIDLRAEVALANYQLGRQWAFAKMHNTVGTTHAYGLSVRWDGLLTFHWSTDGTNETSRNSTVPVPFANGQRRWIRAWLDVDNGAGGHTVTFYTSVDGEFWTQLGAPVITAGVTSIFAGTAELVVGARISGVDRMTGKYYRGEIRSGFNGIVVASPDFGSQLAGTTSFTDSSANLWTLMGSAAIQIEGQPVPEFEVRNPGTDAMVRIRPAIDALGATSLVEFIPRAIAGHPWIGGGIASGVSQNDAPADNRPGLRISAPANEAYSPQAPPAIGIYSRGDITTYTEANILADRITLHGDVRFSTTNWLSYIPNALGFNGGSFQSRLGYYYQLGRMVFVNIQITMINGGSTTNNTVISVSMPTGVDRTNRQLLPVWIQGLRTNPGATNPNADLYTSVGTAVFQTGSSGVNTDWIIARRGGETAGEDPILGQFIGAGAVISIVGWYRSV